MTDPVTLTKGLWWLVGTLALVGVAVVLHELYWTALEALWSIRQYISRRLTRHRRPDA